MIDLRQGDCLEVMRGMDDASVTAIVTDPPYALKFMGKSWDKVLPSAKVWQEALRVLKPGGMALVFGGTRTFHRLTCSLEDAGFQVRDVLCWLWGSDFPKSHNIGKKAEGWNGYGTALKPAWEPIVLTMKPLDGTFAANALEHGVAGINVDGCRIATDDKLGGGGESATNVGKIHEGWQRPWMDSPESAEAHAAIVRANVQKAQAMGRWPANVVHGGIDADWSRFFYCAKASKKDRGPDNKHPTVKPALLMRWLVRMVKMPQDTVVLDPFMGSGSTGVACAAEDVDFIGIERDAEYLQIAQSRTS